MEVTKCKLPVTVKVTVRKEAGSLGRGKGRPACDGEDSVSYRDKALWSIICLCW